MKKKRNYVFLLLAICCISGCGENSWSVENEVLTEPQYETKSIIQENETVQVYDGWERMESQFEYKDVKYVYYPHVENKIKGVSYIEDSYDLDFSFAAFKNINCPSGCNSIKHKAEGCESQCNSQPELEGANSEKANNPLMVVKKGENVSSEGKGNVHDKTTIDKFIVETQDVQAVSFAIYEDFFDTIPKLTVKLYGIPVTLWEEELGNTMEFSWKQYGEFENQYYGTWENQYQDNNLDKFDLLAEKKIEKTGVYYIDYNDLHEKGDYAQILIVLNFDKEMPYTYRMCGNGIYEISDKAAYDEWKDSHMDYYIQ